MFSSVWPSPVGSKKRYGCMQHLRSCIILFCIDGMLFFFALAELPPPFPTILQPIAAACDSALCKRCV